EAGAAIVPVQIGERALKSFKHRQGTGVLNQCPLALPARIFFFFPTNWCCLRLNKGILEGEHGLWKNGYSLGNILFIGRN
ncbi:MAG: hypothetical protein EBS08_02880, partial [Cytophagia bacterium]|nr:hypothetical protein [Cytophagia bacterium]